LLFNGVISCQKTLAANNQPGPPITLARKKVIWSFWGHPRIDHAAAIDFGMPGAVSPTDTLGPNAGEKSRFGIPVFVAETRLHVETTAASTLPAKSSAF